MKHHRLERINEVIRETASEVVLFKLMDPRIKGVTVTRAEVAADLQRAKVFVSVMGAPAEQAACLEALQSAAGFVQRQLGDRLKMRYTPTLLFVEDKGVKNSLEIARLLREEAGPLRGEPAEADGDPAEDEIEPAANPPAAS